MRGPTSATNFGGDRDARFVRWADDLARAFVRLEPRRSDDQPFHGRISQTSSGGVGVSRVEATPHDVQRIAEHAAQDGGDVFFVNIEIRGRSKTMQRGLEHHAVSGDITIVDASEPFRIDHPGVVSLISLTVPRSRMPEALLARRCLPLSRAPAGNQVTQTLMDYAALVFDAAAADAGNSVSDKFGGHMLDLLAYAAELPETGAGSVRRDMFEAYIRRNLASQPLGAAQIAAAFGVSVRYVHKVFSEGDSTVSAYVNDLKLDRAMEALDAGRRNISTIAFQVGYRDLSHFNRRFRRRFGLSPSEYLEARRAGRMNP